MSGGRPRPLPRRPGALERARPRDGEPAAARAPRPGRVHGAARPVGVRARARRALADRPPRRRRGGGLAFLCAPLAGRLPRRLGGGACAAGPRAGRALWAGARRRRYVAGIWLAPLAVTYHRYGGFVDITSLPPTNPTVAQAAVALGIALPLGVAGLVLALRGARPSVDPWRLGILVAIPAAACALGVAMGEGGDGPRHGGAPALAALRPVPGARPGRPGRPRGRARPARAPPPRPSGRRCSRSRPAPPPPWPRRPSPRSSWAARTPPPRLAAARCPSATATCSPSSRARSSRADRASLDVFAQTGASAAYMTLVAGEGAAAHVPGRLANAGRAPPLARRAPGRPLADPRRRVGRRGARLARRRRRHAERARARSPAGRPSSCATRRPDRTGAAPRPRRPRGRARRGRAAAPRRSARSRSGARGRDVLAVAVGERLVVDEVLGRAAGRWVGDAGVAQRALGLRPKARAGGRRARRRSSGAPCSRSSRRTAAPARAGRARRSPPRPAARPAAR